MLKPNGTIGDGFISKLFKEEGRLFSGFIWREFWCNMADPFPAFIKRENAYFEQQNFIYRIRLTDTERKL